MKDTSHLTSGPIRGQLIALAAPLLAGNILQQLYNTLDAVIVGRYIGGGAFAAVGLAGSVMNLFLFLISGSCTEVGVLLSQLYGAGDMQTFRRGFGLSSLAGLALSGGLTALALALLTPLLLLLQTPEDILGFTAEYLRVIFLGFPVAFAFHQGSAALRAAGNTRAALLFLSVSMGANLVLDLLFVAGLGRGIAGAAWATVLAQGLAAVLCLAWLRLMCPELLFGRADLRYDGPLLRRAVRFGSVAALHMCSLYTGKLLVQGTVNGLGTSAVAAYTAALRIEGFANSFGDSGASSMSVFVGQNTGAGNHGRVREGFFTGQWLLSLLGIFMSLVMLLGAEPLLTLVLPGDDPMSLPPALGYLRLVACFYLFNFLGSGLAGYFQGRGRMSVPVIGAASHLTLRVVFSLLLAPRLGLPAVALATGLGWVWVVIFWSVLFRGDQRRISGRNADTDRRKSVSN